MAEPRKVPLKFAPGVVKVDSPYAAMGRYVDSNWIRFVKGKPEKRGGFQRFTTDDWFGLVTEEANLPICRAIFAWDDFAFNKYIAIGTNVKLWLADFEGTLTDVTPIRATASLTDPFAVTDGSAVVTVTDSAHGVQTTGTTVIFDGADAIGGITIDGAYLVTSIIDANTYTVQHSSAATSTDASGGGSVDVEYEIDAGNLNLVEGGGWGVGTWGTGAWGEEHTSTTFVTVPRVWFLDAYGENLLALPSGGTLYQWDPDTSTRAEVVTNAPTGQAMFVTAERYPVILGADGELMTIAWPDQNDITDWTPAITNTARERNLSGGSRLISGTPMVNKLNLLWSDSCVFLMQYIGSTLVYETRKIGQQAGLIGPKAFAVIDSVAYWLSGQGFKMTGGASVVPIPNCDDIESWFLDQLDPQQRYKTFCTHNPEHNEITWSSVIEGEEEPRLYASVHLDDYSWSVGYYSPTNRTASGLQDSVNHRIFMASTDGYLYLHEVGTDAEEATTTAINAYVKSAPIDIDSGMQTLDIYGYFPDLQVQTGNLSVAFETYDYPNDSAAIETVTKTITAGQGTVDLMAEGRQVALTLTSNEVGGHFRVGLPRVEIQANGSRR